MMLRTALLTAAAVTALMAPAYAEETATGSERMQTSFSNTIKVIKNWFGSNPQPAAKEVETDTAAVDDDLQVPPQPGVEAIEPAAGFDDDMLQVPPPYVGPQSRASSFDTPSVAAFGEAPAATQQTAAVKDAKDIANIAPAAGDEAPVDMNNVDCKSVLKAAESQEEGADVPDTAVIEACETPVDASGEPLKDSAQPGFEDAPGVMPQPLPETQPAAGEPPVGGAKMPGEKTEK